MAKKKNIHLELVEKAFAEIDIDSLSDDQLKVFEAFIWTHTIEAAREDFYTYVKIMGPVIIPGFKSGRHIEIISEDLQALYEAIVDNRKKDAKLQVFLPPESTKTVLNTILFPTWVLGKDPTWRVIAVAHSADHAAKELGAQAKRIIRMQEYQEIFPKTKVAADMTASGFWKTTKNGYYYSGGHQTQYPGKRANLLICDDVVSEQTSMSERKTINNNFASGLESRLLEDNSGQLIVNTRWYVDDLSGYLETRDKDTSRPWKIIKVPAILDQETVDYMTREGDPPNKYHVGGSYWPEHKSLENLLNKKETMTPHQWAALYQQSPIPESGGIFKPEMFKKWTIAEPPEISSCVISLDTAFTERETKDAAYSAYQVWGIFPMRETDSRGKEHIVGNMILLDAQKGRWAFPDLTQICQSLFNEHKNYLDFFLIEDRASGQSLIQDLRARGIPVVPYNPERDKMFRANSASGLAHSGRVWVNPSLRFSQDFLFDVLQYPSAESMDVVDAFSQAVLWMRDNWQIIPEDYVSYGIDDEEDNVVPFKRRHSYWQ